MFHKPPLVSVAHARDLARKRLPRSIFNYLDGGNEAEYTVAANRHAFSEVTFRPRAAVAYPSRNLETTILGSKLSMPVMIAPTGIIRTVHRGGELAAARAAGKAGIGIGISTLSGYPIEEITAATPGPVWYQLYFAGGRRGAEVAIDRAARFGCTALILTMDTAAVVGKEATLRDGPLPTNVNIGNFLQHAPQALLHPRWALDFILDGMKLQVPNVRLEPDGPPLSLAEAAAGYRANTPTWADLEWIRKRFPGKIVVKGILRPEDAVLALEHGADAIVVSNHGGNALDSTPATLRVLPSIVAAVGHRTEVLMDGGVHRGADVVKAVALGAKAVLIGRAYGWGLAARGEQGVTEILNMFRSGMNDTLALLGCPGVEALDRSYVDVPANWP